MPGMPRGKPAPVADTLRRYRGRIHAEGYRTSKCYGWRYVGIVMAISSLGRRGKCSRCSTATTSAAFFPHLEAPHSAARAP